MDMATVKDILGGYLRHDPAKSDAQWTVWEHKTFNIHRGVLVWTPQRAVARYPEVSDAVRGKIATTFKPSWWRGFAFGVLAEVPALPLDARDCEMDVDVRDNSKGTWQWVLLACPAAQVAVGIHTWTAGYLSPVYLALAEHYRSLGCNVGSFKKEKDGLMAFLLAASGRRIQEFKPD